VVEGAPERPPQLSRVVALVGDPRHDIAAAEPLGILEGRGRERLAGGEVHELQHHGRGPHVQRDAEQAPRRRAQVVTGNAIGVEEAHAAVDHPRGRVQLMGRAAGRHEDPEAPPEHGELHVRVGALHHGPAGQAVAWPEERLLAIRWGKCVGAGGHLDDALVTAAGATARGRHDQCQLVRGVEQGPPRNDRDPVPLVDEAGRHARRIGPAIGAAVPRGRPSTRRCAGTRWPRLDRRVEGPGPKVSLIVRISNYCLAESRV